MVGTDFEAGRCSFVRPVVRVYNGVDYVEFDNLDGIV